MCNQIVPDLYSYNITLHYITMYDQCCCNISSCVLEAALYLLYLHKCFVWPVQIHIYYRATTSFRVWSVLLEHYVLQILHNNYHLTYLAKTTVNAWSLLLHHYALMLLHYYYYLTCAATSAVNAWCLLLDCHIMLLLHHNYYLNCTTPALCHAATS